MSSWVQRYALSVAQTYCERDCFASFMMMGIVGGLISKFHSTTKSLLQFYFLFYIGPSGVFRHATMVAKWVWMGKSDAGNQRVFVGVPSLVRGGCSPKILQSHNGAPGKVRLLVNVNRNRFQCNCLGTREKTQCVHTTSNPKDLLVVCTHCVSVASFYRGG